MFILMKGKFYYNSLKNVKDYIRISRPYNGKVLINVLREHLEPGSTILEIGMGPGKDMDMLIKNYHITGSDLSSVFLEEYRKRQAGADLMILDARTLEIEKTFDCIYSNKVLHHLSKDGLLVSLKRQAKFLNPGGLIMHSFWEGDREDVLSGMRFVYYRIEQLRKIFSGYFEILGIKAYEEELPGDSIWVLAKRKAYQAGD